VILVFDTNVLLAAYATRGLCFELLEICHDQHRLVLSDAIIAEFRRILIDKFDANPDRAAGIITRLLAMAHLIEPAPVPSDACRDADDLPVLGTAVAGQAAALVTGDRDLLELESYAGIPIITPRQCFDRLG
jgi:uncharacterized protein